MGFQVLVFLFGMIIFGIPHNYAYSGETDFSSSEPDYSSDGSYWDSDSDSEDDDLSDYSSELEENIKVIQEIRNGGFMTDNLYLNAVRGDCIISDLPIVSEDYSLNFLWINKSNHKKSTEINNLAGMDNESFIERLHHLREWAKLHEHSTLNFWYDRTLLPKEAKIKTKKIFDDLGISIKIKNIRKLPLVKKYHLGLQPNIPVYFRIDLAKAIIANHLATVEGGREYAVVMDLDIVAVSKGVLFSEHTMSILDNVGMVYAKNDPKGGILENSFFILKRGTQVPTPHSTSNDRILATTYHRDTAIDNPMRMLYSGDLLKTQDIYNHTMQKYRELWGFGFHGSGEGWLKIPQRSPFKYMEFPNSQFINPPPGLDRKFRVKPRPFP